MRQSRLVVGLLIVGALGGYAAGSPHNLLVAYRWVRDQIENQLDPCWTKATFGDRVHDGCSARTLGGPPRAAASSPRQFIRAASNAATELASGGRATRVSWDPRTGLWGYKSSPAWWQSALALSVLVRYLERTDNTDPRYQALLSKTYDSNVRLPGTPSPYEFANRYVDDTGWWGLAWLRAAEYELYWLHDQANASRFLQAAEWDTEYMQAQQHPCGGISWELGRPAETIANVELVDLTARLYQLRMASGPLYDPFQAARWIATARGTLSWLERAGLVNPNTGVVHYALSPNCQVIPGALPYTQAETAEALVTMGRVLGQSSYLHQAQAVLRYVTVPADGMLAPDGILVEPCELHVGICRAVHKAHDSTPFKGLIVQALDDYQQASGDRSYAPFVDHQAQAVLQNATTDGKGHHGDCASPATCQIDFYWAWPADPSGTDFGLTLGTQLAGLDAFTAMLPAGAKRMPPTPRVRPAGVSDPPWSGTIG